MRNSEEYSRLLSFSEEFSLDEKFDKQVGLHGKYSTKVSVVRVGVPARFSFRSLDSRLPVLELTRLLMSSSSPNMDLVYLSGQIGELVAPLEKIDDDLPYVVF